MSHTGLEGRALAVLIEVAENDDHDALTRVNAASYVLGHLSEEKREEAMNAAMKAQEPVTAEGMV